MIGESNKLLRRAAQAEEAQGKDGDEVLLGGRLGEFHISWRALRGSDIYYIDNNMKYIVVKSLGGNY